MRKFVSFISVLMVSGIAHAEVQSNKLFDCMDSKSFEINSQCVEGKISQNIQYREMQTNIVEKTNVGGDNVMATMKFYPEDMTIEIVAHRDALSAPKLTAYNRSNN